MAYYGSSLASPALWQPEHAALSLADELYACFSEQRPYFLDTFAVNGTPDIDSLRLADWSRSQTLSALMNTYGEHIYQQHDQSRQSKPLKSLWAQWYLGLMVPPLMLALLANERAIDVSPERLRVTFHETGRAARFYLDVREDLSATLLTPQQRLEKLWIAGIAPVINALEATGDINGKLIWSNTGYLVNWFLGEIRELLGDERYNALRHACFFDARLSNGRDNPLYRTVVPRNGLLVRRTCCQRNRLPGVQQCGDCTLS